MNKLLVCIFLSIHALSAAGQADSLAERNLVLHFESNEHTLTADATLSLRRFATELKKLNIKEIVITGHTDAVGSLAFNEKLSKRRANTVVNFLASVGINPEQIRVSYSGETTPVGNNDNDGGRQRNRRVEVKAIYRTETASVVQKPDEPVQQEKKNDTIVYGRLGTMVKLDKDFFEPLTLTDMGFEIKEAFSPCDIIGQGLNTQTSDGNCLRTAGMVSFLVKSDSGKNIPDSKKTMEIWVPTRNPDAGMELYIPDGGMWKPARQKPVIEKVNDQFYYVFKIPYVSKVNLDQLLGPCPPVGPYVKTRFKGGDKVYFNYANETITHGRRLKNNLQRFPEFATDSLPHITAIAWRKKGVYIASKPASEIKYIASKRKYKLRRRDYVKVSGSDNKGVTLAELICRSMGR